MRAYDERLSVPVTWWLIGGVIVAILGAELWAGFGMVAAIIIYAVLAAVAGGTLLHWGSARVRVTDGELLAGGERLPLGETGEVRALDERQTRALRSQHADPAAQVLVRPYLKRAVYIEVTGQGERVPYWLVATRHPEELAAAVAQAAGRVQNSTCTESPSSAGPAGPGEAPA
jgi:Protein of unknown function (DUF3093)